jgi:hypothetical protein
LSNSRLDEQAIKKSLEQLSSIENQINNPLYDLKQEQKFSVHISVDNKVSHGLFKPDPKQEGAWLASEQTYRAMKKDIFAMDEALLELSDHYQCHSCKSDLDLQFWHFCPYCGSQFLSK